MVGWIYKKKVITKTTPLNSYGVLVRPKIFTTIGIFCHGHRQHTAWPGIEYVFPGVIHTSLPIATTYLERPHFFGRLGFVILNCMCKWVHVTPARDRIDQWGDEDRNQGTGANHVLLAAHGPRWSWPTESQEYRGHCERIIKHLWCCLRPLSLTLINWIPLSISKCTHYKGWDEITYQFPNVNGSTDVKLHHQCIHQLCQHEIHQTQEVYHILTKYVCSSNLFLK